MKEKYRLARSKIAPLPEERRVRILDPQSTFAIHYPHAFRVMTSLHEIDVTINEVSQVPHATRLSLLGGCIVLAYYNGTTLVQGNAFKGGAIWKRLRKGLPEDTIWQR